MFEIFKLKHLNFMSILGQKSNNMPVSNITISSCVLLLWCLFMCRCCIWKYTSGKSLHSMLKL